MNGEYRVIQEDGVYWVQFIEYGKRLTGGSYGPHGRSREELLKNWTNFNQALHKPVLDTKGREIEEPLVAKKRKAAE